MKIFYLPDLGEGLAEAEIREWYIKVGDVVDVDQPLVSMETAKAVVDVPSPYSGKITQLHGKTNDIIKTGAALISFDTNENHSDNLHLDKGSVVGKLETSEQTWNENHVVVGVTKTKTAALKVMPAARILAKEMNVDLNKIKGTGLQGLITPDDVKKFLSHNTPHLSSSLNIETETLHGVRRTMAHVMMQAHHEVVPVTLIEDADISHFTPHTDISVLLLNAIVAAAKAEPSLNAWLDGKALERKLFDEIHIGLAVDTEEGLFVPVIKNAESRTHQELRQLINNYKASVKARTLAAKEMQGATITLSNFGMIAGRYATPIVVPPTVAIIGCGRSRDVVMPREAKIEIGRVMPLSLTFDHRAVTGGEATRFLGVLIKHLQENS
jgi:pyruvate dehydrogenase E2 component (dihydrolipoamide acetyltransferase)